MEKPLKRFKNGIFLILLSLTSFSCLGEMACRREIVKAQKEALELKVKLLEAEKEKHILQAEIQNNQSGSLNHLVYFKLKNSLSQAEIQDFKAQLRKLENIVSIEQFHFGQFEDLNDPRALSEYDIAIQMSFGTQAAYEHYQNDPIHLELKEKTISFLAAPPATYDFIVE